MKKKHHKTEPLPLGKNHLRTKEKSSHKTSTKSRKKTKTRKHHPGENLIAPVLLFITIIISYLIFVLSQGNS